jgi:hypothetical protein
MAMTWKGEWQGPPGSGGPARGTRRLRPSWPTATSGPRRTQEATRVSLGKRPRLPQADRALVGPARLARSGPRLGRPPASRARRGRRAGGGQVAASPPPGPGRRLADLPRAPGQAQADDGVPPGAEPEPEPSRAGDASSDRRPRPTPTTEVRRPSPTPGRPRSRAGAGRRGGRTGGVRLAKLVLEMEWALITEALPPSLEVDPVDGDGRADQGLHGPPSQFRAFALR